MISLKNIALVGLGGGIGAIIRFILSSMFKVAPFPYHTFFINVIGSLCIGIVFGLSAKNENFSEPLKLFLATGICGGFTTFSAFSVENMELIKSGNYSTALIYAVTSIVVCVVACFVGFKIINY